MKLKFNQGPLPDYDGLTTYQFHLIGWEGNTSKNDNLVKWINSPSPQALELFVERYNLPIGSAIDSIGPFDIVDGVDAIIDENGEIIEGDIGDTTIVP